MAKKIDEEIFLDKTQYSSRILFEIQEYKKHGDVIVTLLDGTKINKVKDILTEERSWFLKVHTCCCHSCTGQETIFKNGKIFSENIYEILIKEAMELLSLYICEEDNKKIFLGLLENLISENLEILY